MTETTQVWHHVKRELGPFGHLVRIEFPVIPGTPDVVYTFHGVTGWLELKKFRAANRCHNLGPAQIDFARAVARAGGLWHLLGRHNQTWFLYDLTGAEALYDGGLPLPVPLLAKTGPIPKALLLRYLAPRGAT